MFMFNSTKNIEVVILTEIRSIINVVKNSVENNILAITINMKMARNKQIMKTCLFILLSATAFSFRHIVKSYSLDSLNR